MPMKEIRIDLVAENLEPGFSNVAFRTKNVCLTVQDWLDFSAVVEERFPQTVYLREKTWEEMIGERAPSIPVRHRLSEVLDDASLLHPEISKFPSEIRLGFDRSYRPDFRPDKEAIARGYKGWIHNIMDLPKIRLMPGATPRPADEKEPESLYGGRIEMSLERGNKNHLALAQQYFGIIRRHVSKEPLLRVDYPSYESHPSGRTAALEWIGKDAMRWAREDSTRLLKPNLQLDGTGRGYRPVG